MKKNYEDPKVEIIHFMAEDIMTVSNPDVSGGNEGEDDFR